MFDRIARRYDRTNHLMSLGLDRRWRRAAVAALTPVPGGAYLDVGCGTGDVMIEILRCCPSAAVVGVDPASRMLEAAARKFASAGAGEAASLVAASALDMPFDPGRFDGVISAFCIRNVTGRHRALGEMLRVLAPGGRIVLLELTVPDARLLRLGHRLYARLAAKLAGRLIGRDAAAYRHLVDSIEDFPRPDVVAAMMASVGFADLAHTHLAGGAARLFLGRKPART